MKRAPCCRAPGSRPGSCSSGRSDATLICDNMAAQVMREGRVQAVVTGADRIAANGDVANKIGTYGVAVLADGPSDSVLCCRPQQHI